MNFTFICPYYRQPQMLANQISAWELWPSVVPILVVDDCSPEPALDVIRAHASEQLRERLTLLRVDVDIPWNRNGCRNLGSSWARTEWIVHVDTDHVMTFPSAVKLLSWQPTGSHWYRFQRFRRGRADETRRKDAIADDVEYGEIKPHMDSYLTTKSHYWAAGGYDEDYAGCLGGGTPFTKELAKLKPVDIAPYPVFVEVWTRSACADSSEHTLSRDTSEYARRRDAKQEAGNTRPKNPIRFPWHREAL